MPTWKRDKRVLEKLQGSFFYSVAKMKSYRRCFVFEQFIRRCYSNYENAFVFGPNKKVLLYFGLQDVFALSGFPVNGEPLVCDDEVTKDLCDRYLGQHDENAKENLGNRWSTRLCRRWLKEKFEKVPADVDEVKLEFYVRAYILHLIGTFILPDYNNRSHYPAYWLCFLKDLKPSALQRVAWGAAVYCKLICEVRNKAKDFVGPCWLYELFFLERIPKIRIELLGEASSSMSNKDIPLFKHYFPLLEAPREDSTPKGDLIGRLISIRDNMTSEDIILKPYEDYPSYRSQRIFFTRAVTFNFNNLVYHEPEKGHMQLLSQEPKEMRSRDSLEHVTSRGTNQRNLCKRFEKYITSWGERHEESWLMDTNDSSFTLPSLRDQIVLDQEPIADEMIEEPLNGDGRDGEEGGFVDDDGDSKEGNDHSAGKASQTNSIETSPFCNDNAGDGEEGSSHVNSEEELKIQKRKANGWNNFRSVKAKDGLNVFQAQDLWNSMGSVEKDLYKPVEEGQTLSIKCSLSNFTSIVKEYKLNSSVELRDSPFRFLLNLTGYELDFDLINKLASEFDIANMSLKVDDKRYPISLDHFDDILQIGKTELPRTKPPKPPADIVSRFTSKGFVSVGKLRKILKEKEDVDDFKRAFALLCLKYVVWAPNRGKLGKTILRYVTKVEDMKNQPWAGLAMHYLRDGISIFHKYKGGNKKINLGGSMVFLQLFHAKFVMGKKIKELINCDEVSDLKQETMIEKMEVTKTLKNKEYSVEIVMNELFQEGTDPEEQDSFQLTLFSDVNATLEKFFNVPSDKHSGQLLKFCFTMIEDTRQVASSEDSDEYSVTMELLKGLRPNKHLSPNLVNYVADILCVREKCSGKIQRWYFPTFNRDSRLAPGQRIRPGFFCIETRQLRTAKQLFFPLYSRMHFYLIVFNNEKKKVEVWDTLQKEHVNDYEIEIAFLCQFLDDRTKGSNSFNKYRRLLRTVPQQDKDSADDSGVFVCRSMEYPDEVMKFSTQKWISEEQRRDLALRILQAPENKHSEGLREEFEEFINNPPIF